MGLAVVRRESNPSNRRFKFCKPDSDPMAASQDPVTLLSSHTIPKSIHRAASAMEDEPWDELMGPSPSHLKRILEQDPSNIPPVRQGSSASAPPPSAMFSNISKRWAEIESTEAEMNAATAKAVSKAAEQASKRIAFEDEEAEEGGRIRQEALRMLEVADDRLADSSYAVHRTSSGGFMASHKELGSQKRVPAALAGLSFTSSRKNVGKSYRDLEFTETTGSRVSRDDYEYGEDSVVDVVGMEQRFASSRSKDEGSSKNWSDRYSVDHTLLALSGGALSNNSKLLDKMDHRNERQTARNLFGKPSTVFGNGFSFRKNNVYGKQDAQQNLKTVWMDLDKSATPPCPAKSWQEQLAEKRRQRRRYILCAFMLLALLLGASIAILKTHQKEQPNRAVVFYATSDVPYSYQDSVNLASQLLDVTTYGRGDFVVHLGNIQMANETLCNTSQYEQVSTILQKSPFPLFVVPGQEDWNNCPDPTQAWSDWVDNLSYFDKNFQHDFNVQRQGDREENFSFEFEGVLFLGIHVVGGAIPSQSEWIARLKDDVDWVGGMAMDHKDAVRAMVVFGNSKPDETENARFFVDLATIATDFQKPVLYIYGNNGSNGFLEYKPFESADNVYGMRVQSGNALPFVRVNVQFGDNPFVLAR